MGPRWGVPLRRALLRLQLPPAPLCARTSVCTRLRVLCALRVHRASPPVPLCTHRVGEARHEWVHAGVSLCEGLSCASNCHMHLCVHAPLCARAFGCSAPSGCIVPPHPCLCAHIGSARHGMSGSTLGCPFAKGSLAPPNATCTSVCTHLCVQHLRVHAPSGASCLSTRASAHT